MSIASCLTDVPHPGEFLKEEIEARGWLQRDLAYILGVPEQAITMIIAGKRGISPEMAKALGDAFDVSADYFANLQQSYEMSNARAPDPGVARRAALQGSYPVREMIKRGWLEDTDVGMLEAQMMRFFKVNRLQDVPHLAHAAKKADYSETTPTQFAWLYRVKQLCSEMVCESYSENKLRSAISNMSRLMVDPEEIREVPRVLAECGVRFAVVETLPKANIDGVCFWLGDSPVVGMTTRHDRIDNFWFVLRHELEHVLNQDGKNDPQIDVDLEGDNAGDGADLSSEERAANIAAASFCVPNDDMESFYIRKYPFISEKDVLGFSRRVQRHPGIVVGQLQRRMKRYDYLTKYKVKIRHYLTPSSLVDGWGQCPPVSL
ncbi:HTH-type transcriptional regulator/antitoxin HigA [Tardiphaga robiniae]|uniref:HigA family addiction module antitoxin n=1 Tax=Tardiphaga robiniae TaxID=943830 RepID=UPI002861FC32|nr:HigA family addiction module antitoxin [Tardiphaga robiniae]MDR6659723.1 HTH-type transcriptional regulator/antitoxin HigA [Tardiphaga robiniae]